MRSSRPTWFLLALVVCLAAPSPHARAEEGELPWYARLLSPSEAVSALDRQLSGMDRNAQWNARPKLAGAYLDAWAASGSAAGSPEDVLALQSLNASARRFDQAVLVGVPLLDDADAAIERRAEAAQGIAQYLSQDSVREALGDEALADLVRRIEAFTLAPETSAAKVDTSRLLFALAQYHGGIDARDKAIELHMAAARANPARAAQAGRSILRLWMSTTPRLDEYPALQADAQARFGELRELAADHVASMEATADERTKAQLQRTVEALAEAEAPLLMLGQPAPEWTLVHAFGDVDQLADLKGKVVFVDFWATWCGWCIRSFPAVRDLLRDYAGEDLAVIGVTTTAPTVLEANYALDDDMKHKLEEGASIKTCRLASDRAPADPEKGIYDAEAFPAKERETLTRFIANHEIAWPIVMIDKDEPKAKYGLQGWPHAMLIDRQGRIRYYKVGALLRDREDQVKHFREVLDELLAEGDEATE